MFFRKRERAKNIVLIIRYHHYYKKDNPCFSFYRCFHVIMCMCLYKLKEIERRGIERKRGERERERQTDTERHRRTRKVRE